MTDVLGILLYVFQSGPQVGGAATFSTFLSALDHYGREKSSGNEALQARYSTCHNSAARTSHMVLLNHTWTRKDTILAHAQSGKLDVFSKEQQWSTVLWITRCLASTSKMYYTNTLKENTQKSYPVLALSWNSKISSNIKYVMLGGDMFWSLYQ